MMLEYDLQEAEDVMKENREESKRIIKKLDKEMDFLKAQLTTLEVDILFYS